MIQGKSLKYNGTRDTGKEESGLVFFSGGLWDAKAKIVVLIFGAYYFVTMKSLRNFFLI